MLRKTFCGVLLLVLSLCAAALAAETKAVVEALKPTSDTSTDAGRTSAQNSGVLATAEAQQQLAGQVPPFGAELFRGRFSQDNVNALDLSYVITPGDNITIKVWGALNQDVSQIVDIQGNVFLPGVGPVPLGGVQLKDLNATVKAAVGRVFTANVDVYTNLQKSQPVGVFVTGQVQNPGRYTGSSKDSFLYFLDKAAGINLATGSFRDIRVMRGEKQIARIDLYDFLLSGRLSRVRLEDGDVVMVAPKGPSVAVMGDTKKPAAYEWPPDIPTTMRGRELLELAHPVSSATHASVSGTRSGEPFQSYLPLSGFSVFPLADGDTVAFQTDILNPTITVTVRGAQTGPSILPVRRSARLREVLAHIPVDVATANPGGVYLLRKSVADQQKKALQDTLRRLEQAVLTHTSATLEASQIRTQEAEMIAKFVERAKQIQPDGLIVVSDADQVRNIALEAGDVIVLPQKTDVVLISGEVRMPASVVYAQGRSLDYYVQQAGGYTERSNKETIVVRPNGKVEVNVSSNIGPGDQILVLPHVDTKFMPIVKDLAQVFYQIAVSGRMVDLTTKQ